MADQRLVDILRNGSVAEWNEEYTHFSVFNEPDLSGADLSGVT